MPEYDGKVTSGASHAGPTWKWMDAFLSNCMDWNRVEDGTLNVRLDDYLGYTKARRVDFFIPHTTSPQAAWDCYFQRCQIAANGKTLDGVIATTGDNFWGKLIGAIEIRSNVHLRTVLSLSEGSPVLITI